MKNFPTGKIFIVSMQMKFFFRGVAFVVLYTFIFAHCVGKKVSENNNKTIMNRLEQRVKQTILNLTCDRID